MVNLLIRALRVYYLVSIIEHSGAFESIMVEYMNRIMGESWSIIYQGLQRDSVSPLEAPSVWPVLIVTSL